MTRPTLARALRFESLDDILSDAREIAAQPSASSRGSWTPAQNLWHVGRFIEAGVEGYPVKVPLVLKLVGPLFKKSFTTKGFKPGVIKLPSAAAEHVVAPAETTIETALSKVESAIAGAKEKGFLPRNPMMGKMSQGEWIALHCRHAEMHFGLIEWQGA
ncbi:MAG: DUF1569 domain-containing protein [Phycisphaeraceae bacterium]